MPWGGISTSSDGTKVVAAVYGGEPAIYTSADSGAHWAAATGVTFGIFLGVASSSDGKKVVAVEQGPTGRIWTSTNSGAHWTASAGAPAGGSRGASGMGYSAVASSSDGNKLVAIDDGFNLYTSADSGAHWIQRNLTRPDVINWSAVAS